MLLALLALPYLVNSSPRRPASPHVACKNTPSYSVPNRRTTASIITSSSPLESSWGGGGSLASMPAISCVGEGLCCHTVNIVSCRCRHIYVCSKVKLNKVRSALKNTHMTLREYYTTPTVEHTSCCDHSSVRHNSKKQIGRVRCRGRLECHRHRHGH